MYENYEKKMERMYLESFFFPLEKHCNYTQYYEKFLRFIRSCVFHIHNPWYHVVIEKFVTYNFGFLRAANLTVKNHSYF